MKLTDHFTTQEMECSHCGVCLMRDAFMNKLEYLRVKWGRPIMVTSGYRCPDHNRSVGGAKGSQHIKGNAADLDTSKLSPEDLEVFEALCKSIFINAVPGPGFVHCDEGVKRNWSY